MDTNLAWYHTFMILFRLAGEVPIYAFPVLIGVGAAVGIFWSYHQSSPGWGRDVLRSSLWILLGALLFGRIVYAVIHWRYFLETPIQILLVSLGGISWFGCIMGALCATLIYSKINHIPADSLIYELMPLFLTVSVVSFFGSWLDGHGYGIETSAWYGVPSRDEWGTTLPRFPVQIVSAILLILVFWWIDYRQFGNVDEPNKNRDFFNICLKMLGFSAVLLLSSFLRADFGFVWAGLRIDSWASIGLGVLFTVLAILYNKKLRKESGA